MSRCQRECQEFDPPILLQIIIMYRIYYTDPKVRHLPLYQDVSVLVNALECCEFLRKSGMLFVVMVSDYHDMVGEPGASGPDTGYVPQMLS
jgi:hypothetical protein